MLAKKGFTLVELGFVIFILLIVGGAVLTGLNSYRQKAALRFQQNIIAQDLLLAKNYSVNQFVDTDIVFFESGYTISAGKKEIKNTTLAKPFTVSALRLGFNAAGNPRFSGTLYLYRNNKQTAKMTVAVGSGLLKWTKL